MFSAGTTESPGEDRVLQPSIKGQHLNRKHLNWVQWHPPVIPELGRLRQGDHKFEISPGYRARTWLLKKKLGGLERWLRG